MLRRGMPLNNSSCETVLLISPVLLDFHPPPASDNPTFTVCVWGGGGQIPPALHWLGGGVAEANSGRGVQPARLWSKIVWHDMGAVQGEER